MKPLGRAPLKPLSTLEAQSPEMHSDASTATAASVLLTEEEEVNIGALLNAYISLGGGGSLLEKQ